MGKSPLAESGKKKPRDRPPSGKRKERREKGEGRYLFDLLPGKVAACLLLISGGTGSTPPSKFLTL